MAVVFGSFLQRLGKLVAIPLLPRGFLKLSSFLSNKEATPLPPLLQPRILLVGSFHTNRGVSSHPKGKPLAYLVGSAKQPQV